MTSRVTRELGLQRIGTATRFLAVGALLVGGLLSAVVARALPGNASHPATTNGTGAATPATQLPTVGSSGRNAGSQSAGAPPLTAPAQAPQTVIAPPVVSSGGS